MKNNLYYNYLNEIHKEAIKVVNNNELSSKRLDSLYNRLYSSFFDDELKILNHNVKLLEEMNDSEKKKKYLDIIRRLIIEVFSQLRDIDSYIDHDYKFGIMNYMVASGNIKDFKAVEIEQTLKNKIQEILNKFLSVSNYVEEKFGSEFRTDIKWNSTQEEKLKDLFHSFPLPLF